jgi:hypothetical protein
MPGPNEVYLVGGASGGGGEARFTRRLIAGESVLTTATVQQNWFPSGASKFDFPSVGTYAFQGEFRWTAGNSHSISIGFDLSGGGSNTGLFWQGVAHRGDDSTAGASTSVTGRRGSAGTLRTVTGAATVGGLCYVFGMIRILTLDRAIAPIFSFSATTSSPSVDAGTYFQVWKVSDTTDFTTDSQWS